MKNDLVAVGNTGAAVRKRTLTPAQYGDLAEVPPELEWLANITNPKTRRAYKIDVSEFSAFAGLRGPAELRTVTRAHVIAWRKDLESRGLSPEDTDRILSGTRMFIALGCQSGCQPCRRPRGVVDLPSKLCSLLRKVATPLTLYRRARSW